MDAYPIFAARPAQDPRLRHKRIYFASPLAGNHVTNNALLICAYAVLELNERPALAYSRLGHYKVCFSFVEADKSTARTGYRDWVKNDWGVSIQGSSTTAKIYV